MEALDLVGAAADLAALASRAVRCSLRSVVDMKALGERTIILDCDVLQADGGTRTAAITGACVALALALGKLVAAGTLKTSPLKQMIAATSVGIVDATSSSTSATKKTPAPPST